ncbi:hypothetical protein BRADI_1g33903v3 [Brachypodium distachyon]|uniref:Uncharacterized protein n=1 Tax=Brachypodium distachyon TaxID=15368 RepID=A0A0Q3H3A3_BRADI|nr:hypothetical protein BRADI_1g33903v3 [Brachypodium distachyon]
MNLPPHLLATRRLTTKGHLHTKPFFSSPFTVKPPAASNPMNRGRGVAAGGGAHVPPRCWYLGRLHMPSLPNGG